MRKQILPAALALACYAHALLTLQTMRNLTEITDECRERIVGAEIGGSVVIGEDPMVRVLGGVGGGQTVLRGGHDEDDGEVEDTVAASLHLLCSSILIELEKPLDSKSSTAFEQNCTTITTQYHAFLSSTANFISPVQDRQLKYRWTSQSPVFENLGWLQALWASRKTNSQDRSFIEQQIELYKDGSCFEKNEVLRRGVEVVEWVNDLIDMFG